ncbi:hypothetical protein QW131_27415 [Roseibium salinum]|nr:hypothetical protein [Roseibium salinum]
MVGHISARCGHCANGIFIEKHVSDRNGILCASRIRRVDRLVQCGFVDPLRQDLRAAQSGRCFRDDRRGGDDQIELGKDFLFKLLQVGACPDRRQPVPLDIDKCSMWIDLPGGVKETEACSRFKKIRRPQRQETPEDTPGCVPPIDLEYRTIQQIQQSVSRTEGM